MKVGRARINAYRGLGGYGTLGLEIVAFLLIGLFGGRWLDERYGTEPWFFWGGLLFGVAGGVRSIQRAMIAMRREAEREERAEGNPEPMFENEGDRAERRRAAEFSRMHPAGEDEADVKDEVEK